MLGGLGAQRRNPPNVDDIDDSARRERYATAKSHPVRRLFGVPCIARQAERLRNSRWALGQCSPTTLGLAALLGGSEGRTEKRLSKWRGRTLLRKGV